MRKISALDIIRKIVTEVEQPKPAFKIMLRDIQMMRFKIRPIIGDISSLNEMNDEVIALLWKIGRIDEIIHASFKDLAEDDQDQLLEYLQHMELQTENDLRRVLRQKPSTKTNNLLKLEVFRELLSDTEPKN
ncbi:hypothetical protein A2862_04350 [Candidatus Roizmanbacteria bacterium RIFCSPHIGHO2_01_FULL_38_41]|nr:MAG: hypothetical protein A2862_04350 [Candidatus Roizmanbacteria bacterium RIFCSPHIGHO2_01_FULL_38_41]OGK32462.1 MAG: hypothetical protein A3E10_00165 [Candidatus Roizmanbacteria bacterium RIFCSPHIGHO2_12_FULL_37_23]